MKNKTNPKKRTGLLKKPMQFTKIQDLKKNLAFCISELMEKEIRSTDDRKLIIDLTKQLLKIDEALMARRALKQRMQGLKDGD